MNWIDTAAAYGLGIRRPSSPGDPGARHAPLCLSKCSLVWTNPEQSRTTASRFDSPGSRSQPEALASMPSISIRSTGRMERWSGVRFAGSIEEAVGELGKLRPKAKSVT